jgi:GT2 family glycosyltransferase
MRLLIVIVNYRTADLTIDCLRSLAPQIDASQMRLVITDNLSGDDSVARISGAITDNRWSWATLLPLERNGGFAYGNNAAIKPALESADPPEYVLMLNPDTVLRDGAIPELLKFMDANPGAGIAGSRLEDPDATPQQSAFRFHGLASEFAGVMKFSLVDRALNGFLVAPPIVPTQVSRTDWVAGASMIIRREVFRDVGLLDEKYFMYFEEVDFCRAAHKAGWECWYVPSSRVVHLVGAASQISDARKHRKRRPTYWFDSRRRYFVKNHGITYAALADLAFAIGYSIWRVRRAIQRKADNDPPKLLSDLLRNSVFVRGAAV